MSDLVRVIGVRRDEIGAVVIFGTGKSTNYNADGPLEPNESEKKLKEEQRKFEELQNKILNQPTNESVRKERQHNFKERKYNDLNKSTNDKANNYSKQQFYFRKPKKF